MRERELGNESKREKVRERRVCLGWERDGCVRKRETSGEKRRLTEQKREQLAGAKL